MDPIESVEKVKKALEEKKEYDMTHADSDGEELEELTFEEQVQVSRMIHKLSFEQKRQISQIVQKEQKATG